MDENLQGDELLRALKSRADEIQAVAKAAGQSVKRSAALETAAHENGFKDWNVAAAAAKHGPKEDVMTSMFLWRDLERPLPRLPRRAVDANSVFYGSIRRLMRWAQDFERLADTGDDLILQALERASMEEQPYVFVQDLHRWNDDLFRLCNRGYEDEPWGGIVFNHDELQAAGVVDWEAEHGDHGGGNMFSLLTDGVFGARDPEVFRLVARLLAGCALVADRAFERQGGDIVPAGIGFTIDLLESNELTRKAVARLLGCRDDQQHRQLRVTSGGIAYLSDITGNNNLEGLRFRMETWARGNGYVGLEASLSEPWVNEVYKDLRDNWPTPKSGLVDW